jgi:hypothetical protein
MTWRLIMAALTLITLAGCETMWQRVDAETVAYKTGYYAVHLPLGWVRMERDEEVYVTRDGISIQRLAIERRDHDKAFEKTEQQSTADMVPSELADRYIAEFRAEDANGLPSLEILSNHPTKIDDHLGFALHLRFLSGGGLRYERLVNGFATEDGFFTIDFMAPTLYFFERDRGAFETVVRSFKTL